MFKALYYWVAGPLHRRILQESENRVMQKLEGDYLAALEKRLIAEVDARVSKEVEKRMAVALKSNLEYQEKFATKFLDQIVGVYLELERFSNFIGMDDKPASDNWSDEQIANLLTRITREAKITELAREYQVPIRDVLIWRSKYNKMDAATIGKVRALEKENLELKKAQDLGALSDNKQKVSG